ncbi:hypothetical protein [Sphingomonas phage Kimi]|nr:hypothetical protein [Sphingomonas phage Kimi]
MDNEREGETVRSTPWRLDKTINLPMLFTVFTGVVTASIWAGNMNQRMTNVEQSIQRIESTLTQVSEQSNNIRVLDERSNQTRKDLDRVIAEIARRNGISL